MNNISLIVADLILVLHFSIAAFIVLGLVLVIIGNGRSWNWISNPWFRVLHLLSILYISLQSWLGEACPLTRWEMSLRAEGGEATYQGTFVSYWLHRVLYFEAPMWVFAAAYTLFAVIVVICWVRIPPAPFRKQGR